MKTCTQCKKEQDDDQHNNKEKLTAKKGRNNMSIDEYLTYINYLKKSLYK